MNDNTPYQPPMFSINLDWPIDTDMPKETALILGLYALKDITNDVLEPPHTDANTTFRCYECENRDQAIVLYENLKARGGSLDRVQVEFNYDVHAILSMDGNGLYYNQPAQIPVSQLCLTKEYHFGESQEDIQAELQISGEVKGYQVYTDKLFCEQANAMIQVNFPDFPSLDYSEYGMQDEDYVHLSAEW